MQKNITKVNILSSVFLQILTIISGFILPKIILIYFGSEVNGLVSSINQFLNYVIFLEGGIGSVIMASLYKPLNEKSEKQISQIVNTSAIFFKKLSIIYFVYVLAFALIYPVAIVTGFSYCYSVLLIIILALNLFFQYFLSISYKLLLNADRKVAFVSIVQAVIVVMNIISIIVTIQFCVDIILIKVITAIIMFLQPLFFYLYVKKHYRIRKEDGTDEYTEKHKWDGFGINTAFFIHTNTDIVVLTILAGLADVSIYAIYFMIVRALKNIVIAVSSAVMPSFGNTYVDGDLKKSNNSFGVYEFGVQAITVVIFTCGMILITPFVDVYTYGINDANYHNVLFGILIVISEMIYCYRDPYVSASYAAGHIKQVSKFAYIEAGINIVLSVILVHKYGLIGVAIGTIVAMLYRMLSHVIYIKKNVLMRPINLFLKNGILSIIIVVTSIFISRKLLSFDVANYWEWFSLAIKVGFVVIFVWGSITFAFCRNEFLGLLNITRK